MKTVEVKYNGRKPADVLRQVWAENPECPFSVMVSHSPEGFTMALFEEAEEGNDFLEKNPSILG